MYVADLENSKVRTITANGTHTVATLATLSENTRDIVLCVSKRIMYVAGANAVYMVTYAGVATLLAGATATSGYADGTGGAARFNGMWGIALDATAGLLYVADLSNHRIRRITTDSGVVTTIAGSGTAGYVEGLE